MTIGGLLYVCAEAWAAERVALPPGEPASAWAAALEAAGLELAGPGEAAEAVLREESGAWRLVVNNATSVRITPPQTPEARVDLAMLVASLVEPAKGLGWDSVGADPAPPPPRGRGAAPLPAPAPARKPAAVPRPAAPEPPRAPTLPPPPAPASQAPEAAARLLTLSGLLVAPPQPPVESRLAELGPARAESAPSPLAAWADLGLAAEGRTDAALAPGLAGGGGLAGRRWRAGFRAFFLEDALLTALGEERAVRARALSLGLWGRPLPALEAGLQAGATWRTYTQEGDVVEQAMNPVFGAELRALVPLAGPLALAPGLGATHDLFPTVARVGQDPSIDLSPWAFQAGFWLVLQTGDRVSELRTP